MQHAAATHAAGLLARLISKAVWSRASARHRPFRAQSTTEARDFSSIGVKPKPSGNRPDFPVDALGLLWQDGVAMTESESQFSLTRAAS
jgi:hypothetical protein